MVKMRYDLFICFLLSGLLVLGINAIGNSYIKKQVDMKFEPKEIASDKIGGEADDTIPVVKSVDEMKENDRFTLLVDEDHYGDTTFYADGKSWDVIELESGDTIVADVYIYSRQHIYEDDNPFDYKTLLPVGTLVKKSLSQEMLDSALEEDIDLTVTDCYIDMADGNNELFDEDLAEGILNTTVIVVAIAAFILLHILGVKIGLFPTIIPRREN